MIVEDKEEVTLEEMQKKHKIYENQIILNFPEVTIEERIVKKSTALCIELGELSNECESFFKYFKVNYRNDKDNQLKEATDCLAYYMGLSNDLDVEIREPNMKLIKDSTKDANKHFKDAIREISYIDYGQALGYRRICILKSFNAYLKLLNSIGLDLEEVKKCYNEKVYQENIERQKCKY